MTYRNRADMGGDRDALDQAEVAGTTPDVAFTREPRVKYGIGVNLEQELSTSLGLFTRASWNNGEAEEFAFTEIDRSMAAGLSLRGATWGRAQDTLGIAFVTNGWISTDFQRIADPAYNADRGPVSVVSARAHCEF